VRNFRKYRLLLVLLFFSVFIYFLVPPILNAQETGEGAVLPNDEVSEVVEPEAEGPAGSSEGYRSIEKQNVFRKAQDEAPAKEATVREIPRADVNLGLRLVGTAVIENSGKSIAVLEHEDTGKQTACWEGGRLGRVLIKRILQGKVIIDAGGGEMILSSHGLQTMGKRDVMIAKDSPGTENVSPSAYPARLDRKEIAKDFPDYSSFVKTVRIETHFQAGSPAGILTYDIDPDGLFGKMGLQEGDMITEVNGEPLASSRDAIKIYYRLKHGGRVNLSVRRGKEVVRLRLYVG